MCFFDLLNQQAKTRDSQAAIADVHSGRSFSHIEFHHRANDVANTYKSLKILRFFNKNHKLAANIIAPEVDLKSDPFSIRR